VPRVNIVSFVRQFDAGIAPAAHISQLIDAAHNTQAEKAVVDQLLALQATNGWIDLAVISRISGADVRWLYDAAAARFVPHTGAAPVTTAGLKRFLDTAF
jgi:hypothetical protein